VFDGNQLPRFFYCPLVTGHCCRRVAKPQAASRRGSSDNWQTRRCGS